MQPTAAQHQSQQNLQGLQHHQHHASHSHQVSVNFPELAPPSLTPRRRGCGCTLGLLALLLVVVFLLLLALESPFIALENSRIAARMRAAPYRREHPPTPTAEPITLGLWDERKSVTALQLIVCLSLALSIDESHVMVVPEGSYFYRVTVAHEGAWVMEAINAEGSVFLDALNVQAARFGAQLVVSHTARRSGGPPSPSSTTLTPG
jgi:hypothetical protein